MSPDPTPLPSPGEIEAQIHCGSRVQADIERLYVARGVAVAALRDRQLVTTKDLHSLDRLGRALIANSLWHCCDAGARAALLGDAHPHVRSVAALSSRGASG